MIKSDESVDRTQGSTHAPDYTHVNIPKPIEYHRDLTLNDVSGIRFVSRH